MPGFNNVTLNTKVYGPENINSGIASYVYRGTGIPTGFARLTASVKAPTGNAATYRVRWDLKLPVVASESSSCSCVGDLLRQSVASLDFVLARTSTTAERQELLDQLDDLVANADFRASILNLEPIHS
jgi:hypothetical protein